MRSEIDEQLNDMIKSVARFVGSRNPHIEVNDLVQQAWFSVLCSEKSFDPGRGKKIPWARRIVFDQLGNYVGLLSSPVSASTYKRLKSVNAERLDINEYLDDRSLRDYRTPESLVGKVQILHMVRELVEGQLKENPNKDVVLRILFGTSSIRQEASDTAERTRLWATISRIRKKLKPKLKKLNTELKEEVTFAG